MQQAGHRNMKAAMGVHIASVRRRDVAAAMALNTRTHTAAVERGLVRSSGSTSSFLFLCTARALCSPTHRAKVPQGWAGLSAAGTLQQRAKRVLLTKRYRQLNFAWGVAFLLFTVLPVLS